MKKIIINRCHGGLSVSDECLQLYNKLAGTEETNIFFVRKDRGNPFLIEAIETLGLKKASGFLSEISIVEIPDDIEYTIEEYDGMEWVAEKHRTWGE